MTKKSQSSLRQNFATPMPLKQQDVKMRCKITIFAPFQKLNFARPEDANLLCITT